MIKYYVEIKLFENDTWIKTEYLTLLECQTLEKKLHDKDIEARICWQETKSGFVD